MLVNHVISHREERIILDGQKFAKGEFFKRWCLKRERKTIQRRKVYSKKAPVKRKCMLK
jgi:hypothetical protein